MTPAQATLIRRFCYLPDKTIALHISQIGPTKTADNVLRWRLAHGLSKRVAA